MRTLIAVTACLALVAFATTSFAADPPYKVPPGQYCKGVPKKKLAGQKQTQFAQCVTAMAKLQKNPDLAPSQVCKGMKKAKGKPALKAALKSYKQCVKGGNKLKLDQANS